MGKNRRANAVNFGFDFQVNAAIVLMLENIKDISSLRLEGNYEDIEVKLNDGKYILAQAKSVEKSSSDFRNVRKNLKNALISLSEGSQRTNISELILITNSPNPLKDSSKTLFTLDAHRTFSSLPKSSQDLINSYLKDKDLVLDTSKFMIQILPFETDNEKERYKFVRKEVEDFVGDLNVNIPGLDKKLLMTWQNDVFHNSSTNDADIVLSKKELIWPVIVIVTDAERMDKELINLIDPSLYEDVIYKYKSLIEESCEMCEFFIKVLYDFQEYKLDAEVEGSLLIVDFVEKRWKTYEADFPLKNEEDEYIKKALIQIILFSIIKNRYSIDRIKKGVNL